MQCTIFTTKDKHCPTRLAAILGSAFPQITLAGNPDILAGLKTPITGLFCSRNCPGSLILPAFDHVTALRDQGRIVASGFHSEMEQECLKILLRGSQPIIICPARSIITMRIPSEWKEALTENRLLILSTFDKNQRRTTAKLADQRNNLVAVVSDEIFIVHTKAGTQAFHIAVDAVRTGKRTFTINDEENHALIERGVAPID